MSETAPIIVYKDESYAIQGALFEVHNVMGNGFLFLNTDKVHPV
jgi:hypothetical protein